MGESPQTRKLWSTARMEQTPTGLSEAHETKPPLVFLIRELQQTIPNASVSFFS